MPILNESGWAVRLSGEIMTYFMSNQWDLTNKKCNKHNGQGVPCQVCIDTRDEDLYILEDNKWEPGQSKLAIKANIFDQSLFPDFVS